MSPENENDRPLDTAVILPGAAGCGDAERNVQSRLALAFGGRRLRIGSDPEAERTRAQRDAQSSHPLHSPQDS